LNFTPKIPINLEMGVCIYVLGACKSNVMVHASCIEGALSFDAKIPINLVMDMCMCTWCM